MERTLEPDDVALAGIRLLDLVGVNRRPGVDRGIHIAEIPLIGGDLAIGVHVAALQHAFQLVLAEVLIDHGQGRDMEGQIPGGVPGIFPFIGHRNDFRVVHVSPVAVADGALAGFAWLDAMLLEPAADVIVEELLRPEHPGQGLPHHQGFVGAGRGGNDRCIERIGFG